MKNKMLWALLTMPLLSIVNITNAQHVISMQDAFTIASKGNRPLMVESIRLRKADEAIRESRSYLLPSVSANASYNVYGERPVIYLRNETSRNEKVDDVKFGGRYVFDGNINAAYPLFNGQLRSDVKKSVIDARIQEQNKNATEEDLAWEIGNLYLDILLMEQNRVLLEHSLQRNEQSLKDSRSLFLQGKNLKTDTLSNYISVHNLKSLLLAIDNETNNKKSVLKHVLGLEDTSAIVLSDSLTIAANSPIVTSAALSIAEENRYDVKMQKLLIERSSEELAGLKSSFKPQLTALAQYQFQNQSDKLNFAGNNFPRTSFIGLKASIPIYSGKRLRYKTAQLELTQNEYQLRLSDLQSKIKTELHAVSSDLISAYNDYAIHNKKVEAALITYTMMHDRYRHGLTTRLEVTDAEVALTKAKLDLIRSVHLIKVKELQLKKITGSLKLKSS